MEKSVRTDLATEARAAWRKGAAEDLPGVSAGREERRGFPVEVVEIRTKQAAKKLCKPMGRYAIMELDALLRREEDAFPRACQVLAEELRRQLSLAPGAEVLVVGLGNPDITPDAVGPLAAEAVLATRHLRTQLPEDFGVFRPVSVFRAGVLGTTGVESAALTAAVAGAVKPAAVVAIDALAALEPARLCRSVQITDAGIVPGSGVGNARQAMTAETLGVPVVAVGVPTVVDARTLCRSLTGAEPAWAEDLFVTPRDIDSAVRACARLIGYGIDLALHPSLSVEDIDALVG